MKLSTLLLVIAAAGIWLHIYMPAPGAKTARSVHSVNVPMVALSGRVMEKTPEGLILNCPRDGASPYAEDGSVNAFGRFLIKGHPNESALAGGEVVRMTGVDDGTCYSSGEFLQTYRYVGVDPGARPPGEWRNPLDDPRQHVGR